jgi:hypothetical protein
LEQNFKLLICNFRSKNKVKREEKKYTYTLVFSHIYIDLKSKLFIQYLVRISEKYDRKCVKFEKGNKNIISN